MCACEGVCVRGCVCARVTSVLESECVYKGSKSPGVGSGVCHVCVCAGVPRVWESEEWSVGAWVTRVLEAVRVCESLGG